MVGDGLTQDLVAEQSEMASVGNPLASARRRYVEWVEGVGDSCGVKEGDASVSNWVRAIPMVCLAALPFVMVVMFITLVVTWAAGPEAGGGALIGAVMMLLIRAVFME